MLATGENFQNLELKSLTRLHFWLFRTKFETIENSLNFQALMRPQLTKVLGGPRPPRPPLWLRAWEQQSVAVVGGSFALW